jgi:pyroglutamyl-peptidase
MTAPAHRILLTGFEPFDKDSVNPSWEWRARWTAS